MSSTDIHHREEGVVAPESPFIEEELYTKILANVPIVCVDVAIVRDEEVYLIKRSNEPNKGVYWIQGGRLNKNELPESAALRKVAAELSINEKDIKITEYLGTFSMEHANSEQGPGSHTINITYKGEIGEDISPGFDNDHEEGRWFSLNGALPADLSNYRHHPYLLQLFKKI